MSEREHMCAPKINQSLYRALGRCKSLNKLPLCKWFHLQGGGNSTKYSAEPTFIARTLGESSPLSSIVCFVRSNVSICYRYSLQNYLQNFFVILATLTFVLFYVQLFYRVWPIPYYFIILAHITVFMWANLI